MPYITSCVSHANQDSSQVGQISIVGLSAAITAVRTVGPSPSDDVWEND
jgi:hypothetical protein